MRTMSKWWPLANWPPLLMKKKKGRKPCHTGDKLMLILDWIEDNPQLTLKLGTKHCKMLLKSTIERAFNRLDISYKELVTIPQK